VGFIGAGLLFTFYLLCIVRLWPLTHESRPVGDPWARHAARMVISALIGFVLAAQFVTIKYLEVPFYIVLVGAGVVKVSPPAPSPRAAIPPRWHSGLVRKSLVTGLRTG